MRISIWKDVMILLAIAAPAAAADSPATQPATRAAGFAIHGRVVFEQGWALDAPDLRRVAIYLAADPRLDSKDAQPPKAEISQYHKAFDPDLLVIPRGTDVEFPNWDHFYHNVFSRSKAAPPFDLDRYPNGMSKARRFESPGIVHIFCNIHPQMHAIIVVTPNAWCSRADAEGHFELTAVPPGDYELVTWFERSGEQRQPVHVGADRDADLLVTLHEDRNSVLANVPISHDSGYGVTRGLGMKRERLDLPVVPDAHPAPKPQR